MPKGGENYTTITHAVSIVHAYLLVTVPVNLEDSPVLITKAYEPHIMEFETYFFHQPIVKALL